MTDPRWRLDKRDPRFGLVCPLCASPKTKQAAKCFACHVDDFRVRFGKQPAQVPSFRAGG